VNNLHIALVSNLADGRIFLFATFPLSSSLLVKISKQSALNNQQTVFYDKFLKALHFVAESSLLKTDS
jgi:hypothetical protein